jgi:hypothetical protein
MVSLQAADAILNITGEKITQQPYFFFRKLIFFYADLSRPLQLGEIVEISSISTQK